AGFDRGFGGAKRPLRILLVAGGDFGVGQDNRREADLFHAIGDEVNARAVVRLVGITGRILEEARLAFVIPFGVTAGDALLICLIENDVAVGDDEIPGVVDGNLVCLQPIGADARIDVPLANLDAVLLWPGERLMTADDFQGVARLYGRKFSRRGP